jgi:hypothetical protein
MAVLEQALDLAYQVPKDRPFLSRRLLAVPLMGARRPRTTRLHPRRGGGPAVPGVDPDRPVARRVERGEQAFVDMWDRMGGAARYERRVAWFRRHRERFLEALG